MFSLLVLFTVFVGLVVILLLSEQCRRRWRGEKGEKERQQRANLARLVAWLEERGHTLPPPASVIDLLNRVARRKIQSQDWEGLEVTGLLPETQLPSLTVVKILQQSPQLIEFQLGMEWPMCNPGVGVRLVRGEGGGGGGEKGEKGEEVMCELQVDWMYAQARVGLRAGSSGLLMKFQHSCSPQMALSCLVTTPGVREPEGVASSVAHSLQLMFYELELTDELLVTSESTSGEQGEEEGEREGDVEKPSTDLSQNTLPNNHVIKSAPVITANHNSHTHSLHHDKPRPLPDDTSLTPDPTSLSTATVREGEGEEGRGEGEGERGEVAAVQNGPTALAAAPVSRKLWQTPAIEVVLEEREGEEREEGRRVSATGEVGEEEEEKEKEEEGKRASDVRLDTAGAEEEVERKPPDLLEDKEEQVAGSAGEDETISPSSLPVFDISDSDKAPPNSSSTHNHPSPLTLHTSPPPPEPAVMPTRSKSASSWRRSPSYEKLQEFVLPSVQEGGVASGEGGGGEVSPERVWRPSHQSVVRRGGGGGGGEGEATLCLMSPDRRKRQTLSMSGSAYSVESGADEMYPSMLVFEISDSHRIRHIVALSQAHASKLRKRVSHARKLHIYNDHIFVATHLKQRFYCHVCKKKILGFMGKQGYVCRDCNMVVHKHCHYKTEGQCTKSKLSSMNLIYPDSVSTISGL